MYIVNTTSQEIRAEAAVGCYHGMEGIFIKSRSGKKSEANARNPDYYEGLNIIINRLITRGSTKLDLWVASTNMQNHDLQECKICKNAKSFKMGEMLII